jgi:hypothetical protein
MYHEQISRCHRRWSIRTRRCRIGRRQWAGWHSRFEVSRNQFSPKLLDTDDHAQIVGDGATLPRSPRINSPGRKEQPQAAPTSISVARSIERNGKPPSLTLKVSNGSTAASSSLSLPLPSASSAPTSSRTPARSDKSLPPPPQERPLPGVPPQPPVKSVLRSQVRDMGNRGSKPTLGRDSESSSQQLSPPAKSVLRRIVPASGSRPTLADTMSRGRKPKPFEPVEQEITIRRELSEERTPLQVPLSKPMVVQQEEQVFIKRELTPDPPQPAPMPSKLLEPQRIPQIQYVPDTPPASDTQSRAGSVDLPAILKAGSPPRKDSLPSTRSERSSEESVASAPFPRMAQPVLPTPSPVPDDSPSKYGLRQAEAYVDTPPMSENTGMKKWGQARRKNSSGYELFKSDSNTSTRSNPESVGRDISRQSKAGD